MPPKKQQGPSSKADAKQKAKIIEDKVRAPRSRTHTHARAQACARTQRVSERRVGDESRGCAAEEGARGRRGMKARLKARKTRRGGGRVRARVCSKSPRSQNSAGGALSC